MSNWRCPAIEKGVAIYDDEVIRPCCMIDWRYSKPVSLIKDKNRFIDLYSTGLAPDVCRICTSAEGNNLISYRQRFIQLEKQKNSTNNLQFLDIKNSNICNAKCRICGPHHSHLWAMENNDENPIRHTAITEYIDDLITLDLLEIYFTGGEPLILEDHYTLLNKIVDIGISNTVHLRYSSNLSTLKYKNIDIFGLWKQFKSVLVNASAEGIGDVYNNMRSGLDWERFETNLHTLVKNDIAFVLAFTLNNLNIWFLHESLSYFKNQNWNYDVIVIHGPPDYTLNEIPVEHKAKAVEQVIECRGLLPKAQMEYIIQQINLPSTGGFNLNINDQRIYDNKRNESLITLLQNTGVIN